MARLHMFLLIIMASIHHIEYAAATTSANITLAAATGTVFDILAKNNLPRDLAPKGVHSYVLNPNGKIEVTLPRECNFLIPLGGQKYKFQFASTFGGIIHNGSITEVYGVVWMCRSSFAWLGVTQVVRAGNQLIFHDQKFTQSFPVSNFALSPSCSRDSDGSTAGIGIYGSPASGVVS